MVQLNLQSGIPIFEQLREQIARLTALGILNTDDRLPSVRTLAKELSVNPNTVQRAYSQLESNGIIYTVSGKGCFISGGNEAKQILVDETEKTLKLDIHKAKELLIPKGKITNIVDEIYKEG